MDFFSSDIAVAIAWIFSVAGFIYGFMQKQSNKKLILKIQNMQNSNNNKETDLSKNEIHQTGEKNIYTKQNSGGMNIKM